LKQPHSRQLPPIILLGSVKVPSLQKIKKGREMTGMAATPLTGESRIVLAASMALLLAAMTWFVAHSEPSLFAAIVNPLYSRCGLINSEMDFEILLAVKCPGKL
jgi:hypothetical protein